MKILVINPGGTSTKIAVYQDASELFTKSIFHDAKDLQGFITVQEEYPYRLECIENELESQGIKLKEISVVVGRGGLMRPVSGGVYRICDGMLKDLASNVNGEHASNLGAVLAYSLAEKISVPSYVVDPVATDEFLDISRITGLKEIKRESLIHALNQKAVCRHVAQKLGGRYEEYNFIVAHLGSGITIAAHKNGRMIDASGGFADGPFSPERAGALPVHRLVKLCYSGKYTENELLKKIYSASGLYDYFSTKKVVLMEEQATQGDGIAKLVLSAFYYRITCEMAKFGASLYGKVDRLIITGGLAHLTSIQNEIKERLAYLAPLEVVAGEMEMQALAQGALRVVSGQEQSKDYVAEANGLANNKKMVDSI